MENGPDSMTSTLEEQEPRMSGWEDARRGKLERIRELGHDPWGQRFDGHQSVASIRAQATTIHFRRESGEEVALPPLDSDADIDFRAWLAEQGSGELVGPKVRAAGRIVLQRSKGKLTFIDIRDMTGLIQLFVGK